MANSGSQKQISFDLRQESLKRYYPQNPTQAYHDIRRFMESHGLKKVLENASRPLSVELEGFPLEAAAPQPARPRPVHARKRLPARER